MEFIHTGLAVSCEENADRFFVDVLGLEKSEPKTIDKNLTQALFGIDQALTMIHYRGGSVHYEIFLLQGYNAPEKQVAHSCIKATDLKRIVTKCKDAGLKVVQVPKGSGVVTFISDYDGNLFEMKE
ncbi:MAG: VOC family protein [Deltaproteobacteria bacterium]|nr:VOC family protein [Deltaproteobacteria bacterium]